MMSCVGQNRWRIFQKKSCLFAVFFVVSFVSKQTSIRDATYVGVVSFSIYGTLEGVDADADGVDVDVVVVENE